MNTPELRVQMTDYRKEAQAIVEIVMPLIQGVLVKQWATALEQIEDSYKQRHISEAATAVFSTRKIVDAASKVLQARSSLSILQIRDAFSADGCLELNSELKGKIRSAERDFDEALDALAYSIGDKV